VAGVRAQAAVGGVRQPGRMAPVMDTLEAAQREIMALLGSDLKEALKKFDKVPNVGIMGMFTMHRDEIGASMRVLEDVITLVDYCAAYGMGLIDDCFYYL